MEDLKNIIESLLFISDDPLSVDRLKNIIPEAEGAEIREALAALIRDYEERAGAFLLREVAGGYQFRSRSAYKEWIARLVKPAPTRLSKAALETLAIIAYRQPIIRADIEHIRGVDSGGVLRMLMERKLVRVLGRKDIPGRPLIYATTKDFLELFGLKDLKDLPSLKEIETYGRQSEGTPNPQAAEMSAGDLLQGPTREAEALAGQLPASERPDEYGNADGVDLPDGNQDTNRNAAPDQYLDEETEADNSEGGDEPDTGAEGDPQT